MRTVRTACFLAAAFAASLGAGCDKAPASAPATPPPFPDVSRLLPGTVQLVTAAHDALLADGSGASWQRYGRALLEAGATAEAETVLLRAAEMPGNDGPGCLHAAGVAVAGVDLGRAAQHFRAALASGGNAPMTHLRLAVSLEQLGRLDEAETEYRAAQRSGASSHTLLGLGRIALARDDTDAAIELLRRARFMDQDHPEVTIALAQAYDRAGDARSAEQFAKLVRSSHDVTPVPDPYLRDFLFGTGSR